VTLRWRQVGAALLAYLAGQGLVWLVVGFVAVSRAGRAAGPAGVLREVALLIPIALPASLLASAIALIWVLRSWSRRLGAAALGEVLGLSWGTSRQLFRAALAGAVLALVVLPLVSTLSSTRPPPDVTTQLAMSSRRAWGAWIFSAVLLAPPIEELMFRGAFLGGLAQSWSLRAAALTSGLTFWLMHGPEFVHWPAAVSIGLLTVLTTTLRLRTRILGPSVAAHFGYNLMIAFMVSLAMLIQPTASRWASREGRVPLPVSGSPQGEDRQLGRAAEPGGDPGGADPARDIERGEGISIPTLQEAPGTDRLHRRKERQPYLSPVSMTGQQHHRPGGDALGSALREDGGMDHPDLARTARDVAPGGDEVRAARGGIVQPYQAQ
jgi:membrane protease YdiL (CAAX protease family)